MTGAGPAITAHYDTSSVKPAALHTDMEAMFDVDDVQFYLHSFSFSFTLLHFKNILRHYYKLVFEHIA